VAVISGVDTECRRIPGNSQGRIQNAFGWKVVVIQVSQDARQSSVPYVMSVVGKTKSLIHTECLGM
jgi:hypothetical protein